MIRFVHTNIVAKDVSKLINFYKAVLHCESIKETRDLKGDWLNKFTNLKDAHITGEHLLLPGYDEKHPTLEIFAYDEIKDSIMAEINRPGIAHLAFEVDDIESVLSDVLAAGGSTVGEVVTVKYSDNLEAVFVYARDPEGNIIELQSWRKNEYSK
jgi:catechol 2,3-dioxygenase-like lactoylglutathione lyase family enzyme